MCRLSIPAGYLARRATVVGIDGTIANGLLPTARTGLTLVRPDKWKAPCISVLASSGGGYQEERRVSLTMSRILEMEVLVAEKTEIAWCDSTHNEWIGCQKVSAGCDNCFAEALMDTRYGRVEWGQRKMLGIAPSVGTRSRTSVENRRRPYSWQRKASAFFAEHGRRQRIFCSSLSDVFDNQVPDEWRAGLWTTIHDTPDLDWLLLTKRPENIAKMLPPAWVSHLDGVQQNVWLGTTCEAQAAYDKRWPILRDIPAAVRFISYEPAIGPLRLPLDGPFPDWLICGGESGRGYRDMPEKWARDIISDCRDTLVVPFMKQMAGKKEIPADLLVREFPVTA